jgi:hypothetical protein
MSSTTDAYFVVVTFNDDATVSIDGRYWMPYDEAARCVARHNQRMATDGGRTFAVLTRDVDTLRAQLSSLFPAVVS